LSRSRANPLGEAFDEAAGLEEAADGLTVAELVAPLPADDSTPAF